VQVTREARFLRGLGQVDNLDARLVAVYPGGLPSACGAFILSVPVGAIAGVHFGLSFVSRVFF
jgi:hypothetical protein